MSVVQLEGYQGDSISVVPGRVPNTILVTVSASVDTGAGSFLGVRQFWSAKLAFVPGELTVVEAKSVLIDLDEGSGFILTLAQRRTVLSGVPDPKFAAIPDGVHVCFVSLGTQAESGRSISRTFATTVIEAIPSSTCSSIRDRRSDRSR